MDDAIFFCNTPLGDLPTALGHRTIQAAKDGVLKLSNVHHDRLLPWQWQPPAALNGCIGRSPSLHLSSSLPVHSLPEEFVKKKLVKLHGLQVAKAPAAVAVSVILSARRTMKLLEPLRTEAVKTVKKRTEHILGHPTLWVETASS